MATESTADTGSKDRDSSDHASSGRASSGRASSGRASSGRASSGRDPAEQDLSVRTYVRRWWQSIVHVDSRFWTTARCLVKSPGGLAVDFFEPTPAESGTRVVHPIRLYLTVNIVFFFLAPWISSESFSFFQTNHASVVDLHPLLGQWLDQTIERSGVEASIFRSVLDERMNSGQGTWIFLMIPVASLASLAVAWRRRRFFVEHLVFATHLVSFILIAVLTAGLAIRGLLVFDSSSWLTLLLALTLLASCLLWIALTLFRSIRVFFGYHRWKAVAMTAWLGAALAAGSWLSTCVLFLAALAGLRGVGADGHS